jgi:hypothetical protein
MHATDIRMRAEIRAGELLAETEKNKGSVPGKTGRKGKPVLDTRPKLSDLGITKTQSSRWQKLAAMPDKEREAKIEKAKRKQLSAIDGTAKRLRTEMRAADEARCAQAVGRAYSVSACTGWGANVSRLADRRAS